MTKYYKAKIELRHSVEIDVAAETEADARRKAKEIGLLQAPTADIWVVALTLRGETQFNVGSRIKHSSFGVGEIVDLTGTTGSKGAVGFRATVKFDNGDSKQLHLPHASVTPEAFGA